MSEKKTPVKTRKKLIEVALPLEKINEEASRRKRKAPAGYPTTLHKWWAQRPLAAARAVIFSQMVDDPSSHPELFATEEAQKAERQRLFGIIEELVKWENTTNERVLNAARAEIWKSWKSCCEDNRDHPRATELFNPEKLPVFHDPFAGSGAIPLEAQRLGLEAWASDLNPVAVTINKAMIEIPPKFAGRKPVGPLPAVEKQSSMPREWPGATGLAEDVRRYGAWIRTEAEKRIGHLYPRVEITEEMATERPDLKPLVGQKLTVVAWLWARTVKSPNPAFNNVAVPLASTFILSSKPGKETYLEPVVEGKSYQFTVRVGKPPEPAKNGTKAPGRGANFVCLLSGTPLTGDYIKAEGQAGRMGTRLIAIVAEGERGRVFVCANALQEEVALSASPFWVPEGEVPARLTGGTCHGYGLTSWGSLFTNRQLTALATLSDLIADVHHRIAPDAVRAAFSDESLDLEEGGTGSQAYADALVTFLSFALSRAADYGSSLATWRPKDNAMRSSLPKQAIQMTWDFAEGSPFAKSSSGWAECVDVVARAIAASLGFGKGIAQQSNAARDNTSHAQATSIVSTDPPYFANVGYADLSDFFYVWLRRSLATTFPSLFTTLEVPKSEELVVTPHRHGGIHEAETFFLQGMTAAMHSLALRTHPAFPVTIYYAVKQTEEGAVGEIASTGWETFLSAVIASGFSVSGTWPMRTEGDNRQVGIGSNALASSIVLVCRSHSADVPIATRRDFMRTLKLELPNALVRLQHANIAPVDLAQAAIGPGMEIYTRHSKVVDAEGQPMQVREALAIINQTLDEALAEQEGDFDADTRWALAWFEHRGFTGGSFGEADVLSRAKNTSVDGMRRAGILEMGAGKVRLLKPEELDADWSPEEDTRQPVWETLHHLIRALNHGGEMEAAALVARLGGRADTARELAYRLYLLCERKKRAQDALAYNGLVQSWPEIQRLASESARTPAPQPEPTLFS